MKLHHRPPTAGCSFGFDEIALPLYLKAKSKCVLVEFRPRSKPHISKTLGRTLRFPLLRNSFELIGAFVTNVIVALPSVRVWCAKTYDQRFVQDWYIKLIDTCVIVIDPNFTIVIKFRRSYKLLFRFNIKILLCNDYWTFMDSVCPWISWEIFSFLDYLYKNFNEMFF